MSNNYELQYLSIMRDIVRNGVDKPDRTGVGSRTTWHQTMRINLAEGFPILTTRKLAFRIAFEETWFFLRGETDTKKLEEKKINIWKGNTSREYLDKVGLDYLPEGHMGKGYSFQWRNFGGDYLDDETFSSDFRGTYGNNDQTFLKLDNTGVDQIKMLFAGLKHDPNGRRHIVSAWNPKQLKDAALPPCHLYHQYQPLDGKLNSAFLARSQDFLYGTPYNIMGYALLNIAFAKALGLEPGILGYTGEDVHLYSNQIDIANEQMYRQPYHLPEIKLNKELSSLDDILNIEFTDWELTNYQAHPDFKNKPKMAV